MKKALFVLLFQATIFFNYAQKNKLTVKPFYDNDTADYYGIKSLLEIDIVKFRLSKEFYNHKLNIVIDEYTKGKKKEVYSSVGSNPSMMPFLDLLNDSNDKESFELRFYMRKTDTILKQYVTYRNTGLMHYLSLKRGKSYSYKDVYDFDSTNYKIVLGEKFPMWTYTQPVAKKGQLRKYDNPDEIAEFCGIGGGRIPFKNWYKTLGIEHFFIFSIVVEK